MNIDKLRQQFPDEKSCRQFFEDTRWPNGRVCPHCGYEVSYLISGNSPRPDHYECKKCNRQFTVTTKTPLITIRKKSPSKLMKNIASSYNLLPRESLQNL